MRNSILLIAFLGLQTVLHSQEYFPEGTKWTEIRLDTVKYSNWYAKGGEEEPNFEVVEYEVRGTYTGDNGERFKCVYTNGPEWRDSLTLLIQEEGDAEYVEPQSVMVSVMRHDNEPRALFPGLAYQFDWSVGMWLYFEDIESSNLTGFSNEQWYYGVIEDIKEGDFGGVRPLKYVDLDGQAPASGSGIKVNRGTQGGRIIHGIGITQWNDGECIFGPTNPYFALTQERGSRHYRSMLVRFERSGEVLYNVWPTQDRPDGVKSVNKTVSSAANRLYDLQGRRVSGEPRRGGVYISGGRKIVK